MVSKSVAALQCCLLLVCGGAVATTAFAVVPMFDASMVSRGVSTTQYPTVTAHGKHKMFKLLHMDACVCQEECSEPISLTNPHSPNPMHARTREHVVDNDDLPGLLLFAITHTHLALYNVCAAQAWAIRASTRA